MRAIGYALIIPQLIAVSAALHAQDLPPELQHTYVLGEGACARVEAGGLTSFVEQEGLIFNKDGLSGFEFGCQFVDIRVHRFEEPGNWQAVAWAICGDDSGITRPDAVAIVSGGENALQIQSQNEYVGGSSVVSGTYFRCDAAAQ